MASEDKVNALRDHILAECQKQGLTIFEFGRLIHQLEMAEQRRRAMFLDDNIIPTEGIQGLQ